MTFNNHKLILWHSFLPKLMMYWHRTYTKCIGIHNKNNSLAHSSKSRLYHGIIDTRTLWWLMAQSLAETLEFSLTNASTHGTYGNLHIQCSTRATRRVLMVPHWHVQSLQCSPTTRAILWEIHILSTSCWKQDMAETWTWRPSCSWCHWGQVMVWRDISNTLGCHTHAVCCDITPIH